MKKCIVLMFLLISNISFVVPTQRLSFRELKQKMNQFQQAVQRKYELTQRCWRGKCSAKDRKELKRLAKWIGMTAVVLGLTGGVTYLTYSKYAKIRAEYEKAFWEAMDRAGSEGKREANEAVAEVRSLIDSGKINVKNDWVRPLNRHHPKFKGIGRRRERGIKASPLFVAVEGGNSALVKLLLEKGAHPDIGEGDFPMSNFGFDMAPLIKAFQNKNKEIVQLLIDYKADVCRDYADLRGGGLDSLLSGSGEIGELIVKEREKKGCSTKKARKEATEKYLEKYSWTIPFF